MAAPSSSATTLRLSRKKSRGICRTRRYGTYPEQDRRRRFWVERRGQGRFRPSVTSRSVTRRVFSGSQGLARMRHAGNGIASMTISAGCRQAASRRRRSRTRPNMARPRSLRREATAAALILSAVFLTRWPLAPKYLFFFDSANFAYAMEHFDPAEQRPQPPGYPLFVWLTQLLHAVIPNSQHVLVLSGIIGTALAAWCLWRLGAEMFGNRAGCAAAALLIGNPVMWFGGLTNEVRTFLAVCGCGMALLFWRASQPEAPPRRLYLACVLSGMMAGFRPETLLLVLPLLAAALFRRKEPVLRAAAALTALGAGAAVWLVPTVLRVGGPSAYASLLLDYSRAQFHQSSPLFGAHTQGALRMLKSAVIWNGLGAIVWLWFVPLAGVRWKSIRAQASFIALWFVPGFLFQAVVHVADPDQTLFTVPALCLAGGVVLASARAGAKWRMAGSLAIGAFLFFRPPHGIAAAAGYDVVRWSSAQMAQTLDGLKKLTADGPAEVILAGQA